MIQLYYKLLLTCFWFKSVRLRLSTTLLKNIDALSYNDIKKQKILQIIFYYREQSCQLNIFQTRFHDTKTKFYIVMLHQANLQ